jgi:HD-GYP domain-containing protein (c-di-GMP phosphodiesterase class II)
LAIISRDKHISIRNTVVSVFLIATTLTAALAIGLQYYFGHELARDAAGDLYAEAANGAAEQLINVGVQTTNVIELLVEYPVLASGKMTDEQRDLFATVMRQNPLFYGVFLGRQDGSFDELINLPKDENARKALWATEEDRWVIVRVEGEGRERRRYYKYLDEEFNLRSTRSEPTDFDVRTRPWYQSALANSGAQTTDFYTFAQLRASGQTMSKRVPGTDTVVGVDMTLTGISRYLSEQVAANSQAVSFVYKEDGRVVASSLQSHLYISEKGVSRATGSEDLRAVPNEKLVEIAGDPGRHDQLIEVDQDGALYFAFVRPMNSQREDPNFFGILVPADAVIGPFMARVKLSIAITAAFLVLLLPLSWLFSNPIVRPIRQLADENDKIRRRAYNEVQRIYAGVTEIDELSESMVNMVDAISTYELQQRELMDSFIQLIAQAIDDKSAYTGGHCARVPELAFMLAAKASQSDDPAFKDFTLDSEDQWREYRISAWLHDCGKITTPEHIVDKGSKLETIYNRIHEVRMRFEVLWRDAEIRHCQQLRADPERESELASELAGARAALREEFEFIAQCNVGGEFLDESKKDRLRELSRRTWQRNFDDRLGLSPLEELRGSPQPLELPVEEPLLGDKPEHIIERTRSTEYAPELGIDMAVPEHLYNLGELYNLSVSRGTLTEEDRFKINEHMISTIKMLEALPFPPELKNVPRYASTHHETMRGSGYPRKLPGHELSIPERILAVADVFEALTAADRPYKKAKPVSEAIDILHKMVLDNHIDQHCFELFIRSKVYRDYAEEFLAPEQRDEVDESKYVVH